MKVLLHCFVAVLAATPVSGFVSLRRPCRVVRRTSSCRRHDRWPQSRPTIHYTGPPPQRRQHWRNLLSCATKPNDADDFVSSSPSSSSSSSLSDRALGILVLLTVPLAWGTYTPVVKYLYQVQPAVPGFVFSAAYYIVASLTLFVALLLTSSTNASTATTDVAISQPQDDDDDDDDDDDEHQPKPLQQDGFPWLGGWELGTYLFLGNALQIIGLKTVPSDRAGFLVQLTTVMVPLVEAAFRRRSIPVSTWLACLLAFGGVLVMGLDDTTTTTAAAAAAVEQQQQQQQHSLGLTSGDGCILGAALVYTLHVVRLGQYAQESSPLRLATTKATAEAILSTALVGILYTTAADSSSSSGGLLLSYAQEAGREIATFGSSLAELTTPATSLLPAVGAVLWTGWVTCAYTIYAQSFGQKRVRPTVANLIYTIQPLFTALFAWLLLGETLGPAGIAGGSLIASAVYLVVSSNNTNNKSDDENDHQDKPPSPTTLSSSNNDKTSPALVLEKERVKS